MPDPTGADKDTAAATGLLQTKADIQYQVERQRNPKRLYAANKLLSTPGARVFIPRSAMGASLYDIMYQLDEIYQRAENKLLRGASLVGLERKQALERQLMEVNTTLVAIAAQMAHENGLADAVRDPTIRAKLKELVPQPEQSESPPSNPQGGENPRRTRRAAAPEAAPTTAAA